MYLEDPSLGDGWVVIDNVPRRGVWDTQETTIDIDSENEDNETKYQLEDIDGETLNVIDDIDDTLLHGVDMEDMIWRILHMEIDMATKNPLTTNRKKVEKVVENLR
ncbi:hypothetical protein Pint_18319 [Pistacia integerrima]|uniref:Uncharacterized protein n=1 Tax=Pistacia integerrima TaxID=434235 RepID=A0ACC0YVY8_9ROSI|nr:hypothetical protein Pint_18319 [Pistacia integerrima]